MSNADRKQPFISQSHTGWVVTWLGGKTSIIMEIPSSFLWREIDENWKTGHIMELTANLISAFMASLNLNF